MTFYSGVHFATPYTSAIGLILIRNGRFSDGGNSKQKEMLAVQIN